LPVEVAEELKWFVWNDIWARVNSRLAGQEEGKKRLERQKQAREDVERADSHFRKAVGVNIFSKSTLHYFRRQVAAVGSAAAIGAKEGNCQQALDADVMKPPEEIQEALWSELVEAIKTAAVAANMMSREEQEQARPLQAKFEEAWREFEQDINYYTGDYDTHEEPPTAKAKLPRALASDLKWFAWNGIWARVNAALAGLRDGAEGLKRQNQAQEDAKRAELHYQAALAAGAFSEATLSQFRKQVEALAKVAVEGLREGNWLLTAQAQALQPPQEIEEQLWSDLVKAVKCAGVAANVMSRREGLNMSFQAEFDEAWDQLEVT